MKTAVDAVFVGKERVFNQRFLIMADHYMVEPTACTPASGCEKGRSRTRSVVRCGDEADWRFVRVLPMVLTDGLEPVEAAVAEALAEGAASDDVVVNILARRREPERPEELETAPALTLVHAPVADCARYDLLRGDRAAA